MVFRHIFFITLFLLAFSFTSHAFMGRVQQFDPGRTIAWGNGDITVVREIEQNGENAEEPPSPMAVRKAASQARKLMLDMIMSIRIDARQTVSAYLADNDELAAQLRGLVHNSLFEGPDLFSEVKSIKVSESLRGKLAELILPTTVQFQSGIPPRLSTATGPAFVVDDNLETVGGTGGYTGVIVDARGLDITPCLLPVIYGQDGLGAYGTFLVSRKDAIEKGVVAYTTTADPAALVSRVGTRPLSVKAARAYGSWKTDLIVSTEEAKLIRAIMQSDSALKNGVVIAIDSLGSSEVDDGESNAEIGGGSDA